MTGTIACISVASLLLTGSTLVVLGESAVGNDARAVPGGDIQAPGDLQQAAGGDVNGNDVSNGDVIYYAAATGNSAIVGVTYGL